MNGPTTNPTRNGKEKVSVRDLNFYYGAGHALKGITLPLYERQVTAFIGPSGCGKSTLLRVLNRMYDLYPGQRAEGEVMIGSDNIIGPSVDLNRLRRRVGMVFQKPTPFPMSSLPAVIFQFALSPYKEWQQLAWTGALIITLAVLTLSIVARALAGRGNAK